MGDDRRQHVELSDTLLFPEGGGQPADHGRLNNEIVADVQWRNGRVVHILTADSAPLQPGAEVSMTVDWPRRWHHMQHHTGQHLLTALTEAQFKIPTVGWYLGAADAYVDLGGALSPTQQEELEAAANDAIRKGIPVTTTLAQDDPEAAAEATTRGLPDSTHGPTRLVTIAGFEPNMCCGTHVSSLKDLQLIKTLQLEALKGGKISRLHFVAGATAIDLFAQLYTRERELIRVLTKPGPALIDEAQRLVKLGKVMAKQNKLLMKELAVLHGTEVEADPAPFVIRHRDDGDLDYAMTVASTGARKKTILITCGKTPDLAFLLAGPDAAIRGPKVVELLQGKGSAGRQGWFQGKFADPTKLQLVRDFFSRYSKRGGPTI